MRDPFDLAPFVNAQAEVMPQVLQELAAGRKASHWMWFVFPQLRGLGASPMATFYGLTGLDEARAWLAHPVLGPRLLDCVALVNRAQARTAREILGDVDALKFRSCLTLFAAAAPEQPVFRTALDHFFHGDPDPRTLDLLAAP
jgi:uncharacterized protein (DUF1810 family)